jgi:hypothetical protein
MSIVTLYHHSTQAVRSSAAATKNFARRTGAATKSLAVRTGAALQRAATSDVAKFTAGIFLFCFAAALGSSLGHKAGR